MYMYHYFIIIISIFFCIFTSSIFFEITATQKRHKEKLQPPSGNNNNCWSVTHAGFHRIQGLDKGSLMPHFHFFFTTILHPTIFFIAFPNSCFVSKNNKIKSKNCKGTINDFVWRETSLTPHPVDSRLQLISMVSQIPHKQAKKSYIPCLNSGRSQGSYPASRVAVKSHFLLRYTAFSHIPYHILVKSWIPRPWGYTWIQLMNFDGYSDNDSSSFENN